MLFNTMPTITNTIGIATITIGCMIFSLIRLWVAFGFWKRQGSGSEYIVAVKPGPNSNRRRLCVARLSISSYAPLS